MRENRVDIVQACLLALLVHLVPLLLLLVASLWRAPQSVAAGEPIVADVIDPNALSARMRSALRRAPEPLAKPEPAPQEPPPPEPALPEPLPETPPEQQLQPQEQLPDPDTVDQQAVTADAAAEAAAAQREQEARRRQAQVDLTDERRRQEQAEQRQSEMQRQRDQQLADIRRQRAQAQSEATLAEERLRQLADQRARQASAAAAAAPPPGNRGTDPDLTALYRQALIDKIRSNWTQPDNVSPTQVCKIVIKQIPGGQVIDAQVDPSCPYDEAGRRSVEAAVLKAQPLPHRGFETVFSRTLTLNFRAEDR
jgi:colicin import membrane protein